MFLDSFDWHPYFSYLGLSCFFHEGHLFLGFPKNQEGHPRSSAVPFCRSFHSKAEKEWQLHEGGKLRMICRFRDLSEDFVEACFLNCNEECRPEGLIPSKSLRACSLCGEGSFFNFIRWDNKHWNLEKTTGKTWNPLLFWGGEVFSSFFGRHLLWKSYCGACLMIFLEIWMNVVNCLLSKALFGEK